MNHAYLTISRRGHYHFEIIDYITAPLIRLSKNKFKGKSDQSTMMMMM